jgi:hypothetical protein
MDTWRKAKADQQRRYWVELAEYCRGNVSEMGRISDVRRGNVYKILRSLGLLPLQGPRPDSRLPWAMHRGSDAR